MKIGLKVLRGLLVLSIQGHIELLFRSISRRSVHLIGFCKCDMRGIEATVLNGLQYAYIVFSRHCDAKIKLYMI